VRNGVQREKANVVEGQNELLYLISQRLFIILARGNTKDKTHITHIDITLFNTKWLANFNPYK
jgi:hypothetical protein